MRAFARTLYFLSWAAFYVACGGLTVSFAAGRDAYHKVVDELPPLESDMGRIFFFGSNKEGFKKATLSINDEELDGPYGNDIFFYVDRVSGEYVISVNGEVALQFELGRGEEKYVAMDSGRPINPESGFFKRERLPWSLKIRLLPASHAEAVMKNMRWKK